MAPYNSFKVIWEIRKKKSMEICNLLYIISEWNVVIIHMQLVWHLFQHGMWSKPT